MDDNAITRKFAEHFYKSYSCNSRSRANSLFEQFTSLRSEYVGARLLASHAIDTELVSDIVSAIHRGKAPDITGLTGEHLQYSHPSVIVLLAKLFQLIILSGCIPDGFKH